MAKKKTTGNSEAKKAGRPTKAKPTAKASKAGRPKTKIVASGPVDTETTELVPDARPVVKVRRKRAAHVESVLPDAGQTVADEAGVSSQILDLQTKMANFQVNVATQNLAHMQALVENVVKLQHVIANSAGELVRIVLSQQKTITPDESKLTIEFNDLTNKYTTLYNSYQQLYAQYQQATIQSRPPLNTVEYRV